MIPKSGTRFPEKIMLKRKGWIASDARPRPAAHLRGPLIGALEMPVWISS
jgi:hypothetical protein